MLTTTLRPATAHPLRHAVVVLAAVLAASLVGVWSPQHADATSYRFWSYWTGGSSWTFASQGAARRPADGAVEGWRFAVSPATSSTIPPRHSPSFDSLCGKTPAQDGKKRVGLVVDSGLAADAPGGESPPSTIAVCAVVPTDATGYDVLMTVATLRTDQGLVCGINGYPASECGAAVADPSPSQSDGSGTGGSSGAGGDADGAAGAGTSRGADGQTGADAATDGSGSGKADDAARDDEAGRGSTGKKQDVATASPEATTTDDTVAAAATTTTASPGSGSPLGLVAGAVVVAGLAAAAFFATRRRRA